MKKKLNNKIKEIIKFIKKYRRVIAVVLFTLLILAIIIKVITYVATKEVEDPSISSSFFIVNDDSSYALFSDNGKQLTDFEFNYATSFYNGIARVENDSSQSAIINEKGKYVIEYDEYDKITAYGSLLVATKDEKKYLLNKKGKKILKSSDFKVYSSLGIDSFIIVQSGKYYYVYLYDGSVVTKFKVKENVDAPEVNEEGHFASVYYNNKTYLFNSLTGKILSTLSDKTHYCISSSSTTGDIITLNSCVSWYESNDKTTYKVLKKNRVVDISDKCERVYLDNDNLVCVIDSKGYLLNDDNEPIKESISNMSFENYKTYAYTSGSNVKFVKNNNKKKTYEGYKIADRGYSVSGIYLLYKDKKYSYVYSNGKLLSDTTYKNATSYDENGLAKVSEDGKKYFLINKKGKKVSDEFDSSIISNNYYIIKENDKLGLLNKKGKEILENKYSSLEVREYKNKDYAYTFNGSNYELYDISKKKTVITSKQALQFYDNYIKISEDKSTKYYTYSGKLLYENKSE